MPYTEAQFKSWLITKGALYYKIESGQLTVNPWEADAKAKHGKVGVSHVSVHTGWTVYSKCYAEKDDMIMGRLSDTAKHYVKYGLDADGIFNLTAGQHISVQKLKNWTTVINDCWLLGAVNACKTFHLVSPVKNIEDNVYNFKSNMFVVTGRELTGLRLFGYKPSIVNGKTSFVCSNKDRAANATFQEYAEFMNKAANSPVQKAKTALFAQGIM
jgi:hypothetical protein